MPYSSSPPPSAGRTPWHWLAVALVLAPLAAWIGGVLGENSASQDVAAAAAGRGALYRTLLQRELERPSGIPLTLARDPLVMDTLAGSQDAAAQLNEVMADLVQAAELTDLYLMDAKGMVLAASNARDPISFIGHDFSFRSYFTHAMQGKAGHEFAIGTTSQVPGYYVAQPIMTTGRPLGVVVAKVELTRLEKLWANNPERLMLIDRAGRVLLTNVTGLQFQPMPVFSGAGRLRVEGIGYMAQEFALPWDQWRLAVLSPTQPIQSRRLGWAAAGGIGVLLILLLTYAATERRRTALAIAHYERNSRVAVEAELGRRTAELLQATKLATIGQMAAGMVHEVNQPLAAIHAFAGNAQRFMELGKLDKVSGNLTEIAVQVERLAEITRRLKGFARRPDKATTPLSLVDITMQVLSLLGPRLREQGVTVSFQPDPGPNAVMAERVRLEQVLVNLISNALDAMKPTEDGALSITIHRTETQTRMDVADTGPGIPDKFLPHLFEPFYTTKPAGEGLGLGLSVSSSIVRDFGGTLTANNRAEGGAVFILTLPNAMPASQPPETP